MAGPATTETSANPAADPVTARQRGVVAVPAVVAGLLCAVVLAAPPIGTDLAAQEFRTWLFRTHGFVWWNGLWYAGHPVAGYSLLYPPLAALVGTRLLGAIACVAAAAAGAALAGPAPGRALTGAAVAGPADRATRLATAWFALACAGVFVQGQLPFLLGLALALAAGVAARGDGPGRRAAAALAALAASLASPLAGAFLLLGALAWWPQARWRAAPLAAAVVGVVLGMVLGGGGSFPFPLVGVLTVLLFCVGGWILVGRENAFLRRGLTLYGVAAVALAVVPNAVGGNAGRLGALAGGPLAVLVLGRAGRWRTAAVVAVPLLTWQVWPVATALLQTPGDPSSGPGYYVGLHAYLRTQDPPAGRLEVTPLRRHWETAHVAPVFPLARGWERQVDLRHNAVLYRPDLTADQLHTWLVGSGVRLVALADAPLDPWAHREAQLLRAGQPWLVPVWHDAHWQVWRVADAPGLTTGPAHVTRYDVDTVQLQVTAPGDVLVRVHADRWWRASGRACVRADAGPWLSVHATAPGPVVLTAGPAWPGDRVSGCPRPG